MKRLFYSTHKSDTSFEITGEDYRHLLKVLRRKIGDSVDIIDGSGYIYNCVIAEVFKEKIIAAIKNSYLGNIPSYRIAIAISPVKNPSRFEWFVEKAVEIGITDIYPVICKRTEKSKIKYERAIKIMHSAMKQSGNVLEPILLPSLSFTEMLQLDDFDSKYIAYISDKIINNLSSENDLGPSILIAIGPEGGFEKEEASMAASQQFKPVSLGDSRLRTETAGVVACQIVKTLDELNRIKTMNAT
ncbi:16S rRNA (uracil(1498)-N(3))-methyltransferase [uncultured Muriicola sp.]|uniref:RsmE family RNA methyltransferase n=1 Tax=uncultured Muriicola sp. TaxID=1583102 RepID=UPI00260710F4|nr:RsmE family RNA methyltransferase [uncultured Muriicola sp.]